jgi:hypothetical protein
MKYCFARKIEAYARSSMTQPKGYISGVLDLFILKEFQKKEGKI